MTTTTTSSSSTSDLDDRARPAVLVTGCSRGLGAVVAEHLAERGYRVFAGMRRPIAVTHRAIRPLQLDVTDRRSIDAAAEIVADETGSAGLVALVNNAAILEAGPLLAADAACVDRHLRTNVAGPLAVSRAVLPMLRRAGGRIVNVSSINAKLALPYWGLYCASKAALDAVSDSLRLELAADGIGVTVLTLGAFDTDIRRRGMHAWPTGVDEPVRRGVEYVVDALDATAAPTAAVGAAVLAALVAPAAPAYVSLGDGIDDLLALAAQPAEVRDQVIAGLLGTTVPSVHATAGGT